MSNYIAGVLLGRTLSEFYPGLQFNKDYLYGSMWGQLLQENIETSLYTASSTLIDPSALQQAVMGAGQGGPYQINNYDVDLFGGSYTPAGYAMLNYIAIQKNMGFTFAQAPSQFSAATPASFNNKYYGPSLTTFFHLNDMRALYALGQTNYSPAPQFNTCLANLKGVANPPLDVIINYAYNQGYYGGLVAQSTALCATNVGSFVSTYNSYSSAAGDTYHNYPYQVRFSLDQMYDNQTQLSETDHVVFNLNTLGTVFAAAYSTLAYVNGGGQYVSIPSASAQSAYTAALTSVSPGTMTLDLSNGTQRATIFRILETATANLETTLGTNFSATTLTQL